jgi:hypothetical protein
MANIFCNDDGSNTSPYETWAKAATTFLTAVNAASPGDDIIIGADHTEDPGASVVYAFSNTQASPNRVISSTVGAGSTIVYNKADNIQINLTGIFEIQIYYHVHFYGVSILTGGTIRTHISYSRVTYEDCRIELAKNGNALWHLGASGGLYVGFKNTDIIFSGASGANQFIRSGNDIFEWRGGTLTHTEASPVALFDQSNFLSETLISGVDLSDITSAIFDLNDLAEQRAKVHHCLLNSSVAITTGTINNRSTQILVSGCDDTTGNNLYRLDYTDFWGSTVHDDAIYRNDGASDGTTNISWKMVSTANAREFSEPTKSSDIIARVDSTGEKTFTVHVNWDDATDLDDDEIWLEIEFLEASADTDSAFADDRMADITATPAAQATSTEAWTGTGGFTNENKQQLDVTVTVNRVGPVIARVCLAKPSTTVYVDPKLEIV